MTTIRFHTKNTHEDTVTIRKARYADGSTALMVADRDTGQSLCTATVCLADYDEKPADGHVFVKDYSENEGTLQALQDAGVIGDAVREVPCGYVTAYECPLTMDVDPL